MRNSLVFGLAVIVLGATLWALLAKPTETAAQEQPASVAPTLASAAPESGERAKVRVEAGTKPIPVGVTHEWFVNIANFAGETLTNCEVHFDGEMPEHGHGLPTAPRVTGSPSPGRYRVEGVRFSMPGYWLLAITTTCGGAKQTTHFELRL